MHACVWNSFMEREARRMLPCLMSVRLEGYECYTVCSVALRAGSTLIVPRGSRAIRESGGSRSQAIPFSIGGIPWVSIPSSTNFFVLFKYIYIFFLFNCFILFFYSIIDSFLYIFLDVNCDWIFFWKSIRSHFFRFCSFSFSFTFYRWRSYNNFQPVSDSDKINNF